MALHSVVKCNIRLGMQAAIETPMWVTTVLLDGLILRPVDQRHLAEWRLRYDILYAFKARRWSAVQWDAHGYVLCRDNRPSMTGKARAVSYLFNQIVPYPKGGV